MGTAKKHRKTREFLTTRGRSAAGAAPLPYGKDTARSRRRGPLAGWGGAPQAADPPTPGPEKHRKILQPGLVGESFLGGIRVAHKRLQEHSPPPVLKVPN
jgi:hypothetical protein